MLFNNLINKLTGAVCEGDGDTVASCFIENGVYHDVFYGSFKGRPKIKNMIISYFHRDACNFRWDLHNPVSNGKVGYCRYIFSYESKLKEVKGVRTMFEGVAIATLEGHLIKSYSEVANALPGLRNIGFTPERLARIAEKQGAELQTRKESIGHY